MSTNYPPTPGQPGQTPPTGDLPGQTPPTVPPPGQTPGSGQPPPTNTPPPPSGRTLLSDLPTDIQEMIRSLRKEAKDNREALEARARADAEAEQARLKEAGQFKELAEKHEMRVKELEPLAQRYAELAKVIGEQLEAEIKDWPPEVKAFDPGKDAPIEQRLAWRTKSRALVERLASQTRGAQPGMARNPPTGGQPTREDLIAANMEAMRKERKRLL